jgi:shikimate kinase
MTPFRRVYITGFMGCGKTTAGKKLASSLNFSFIDLDHEIEMKEKRAISEIFSDSGEDYFRKSESEVLRNLDIHADTVVSTGGGTPCHGDNLLYMRETGIVVYLKMTPLQLAGRLGDMTNKRPLLKDLKEDEMVDFISRKLKEREPFYNQATVVVDGIDLEFRSLSDMILGLFP